MRSPEVSIGQSVSVAPRPSIAPSFSRPSFESFKHAPVASIVRHPGVFNPNISVSIDAPKLGSIGGESKPFSFSNTKPIEAPKNLPFADKKPQFSLKDTQVIAKNKTADTQPASDKSSQLDALFGLKLSAHDIQLKGVEKFGGMKTQLPVKPEMHSKSALKPKESIIEHVAKLEKLPLVPKTETVSKPKETIQQRIARLERIPLISTHDSVNQIKKEQTLADRIATLEPLPLIMKTNKAESISQHIAKLEKIPLHPKVERVVAAAILERIVLKGNERFKHLEQLPLVQGNRINEITKQEKPQIFTEISNPTNVISELKSQIGERKIEVIAESVVKETAKELPLVKSEEFFSPIIRKEVSQILVESQIIPARVTKAESKQPFIKITQSTKELTQMMTQIEEIVPSFKIVRPEVKTSTIPLAEIVEKEDEETKALKATSEFQALLKNRSSLKKQGFTEAQLDRLMQLRLQAQKMPAEDISKVMETMHTVEQKGQLKEQHIEKKDVVEEKYFKAGRDSKAMNERARVVDTIADQIEKEGGSDVRVDGEVFAELINEKQNPKMRSQILEGIKKEDKSLKQWKENIRSLVHDLPVWLAKSLIKKLSEQTKAVEITDRVKEGATTDDLYRVAKNGDLVNVQNLAQTHKIYYRQPIELVSLSAQQRQQVITRQA